MGCEGQRPERNVRVMGDEGEPSWLSSLVGKADKLILSIVGYGEKQEVNIFSDDESDGESVEEGERNDAQARGAIQDPAQGGGHEGTVTEPEAHAPLSPIGGEKVLPEPTTPAEASHPESPQVAQSVEGMSNAPDHPGEERRFSDGDGHAGDTDQAEEGPKGPHDTTAPAILQSLSAPARAHNVDPPCDKALTVTQVDTDEREEGRQENDSFPAAADSVPDLAPLEARSYPGRVPAQRTMPEPNGPPRQTTLRVDAPSIADVLEPTLVTPFRTRTRTATEREPPVVGMLPSGRRASRRAHRDGKTIVRQGERTSKDLSHVPGQEPLPFSEPRMPAPAPKAVAAAAPPTSEATASNAEESYASPDSDAREPEGRRARGNAKKFSFASDTSWMRRTDRPAAKQSYSLVTEQEGVLEVAPNSPSRKGRMASGPLMAREARPLARSVESIATHGAARENLSEMEESLGQDVASAPYGEVESERDSDGVRLSSDSLHDQEQEQKQEQGQVEPRRQGVGLTTFGRESNGGPPEGLSSFDGESGPGIDPFYGAGASDSERDDLSPVLNETDGPSTIGSKRASTEGGPAPCDFIQAGDWMLDSPEGFAPSKRGKTEHDLHPLAVMRHSSRLDDAIHERKRKLQSANAENGHAQHADSQAGAEALLNGLDAELAAISWPDRALRPYDTPILDADLPARQAKQLDQLGFGKNTLIVSSPFRRCLQTAGVVARTLGVGGVTVHLQAGERMDKVRKETEELALALEKAQRNKHTRNLVPCFSYLSQEDMQDALGDGVRLRGIVGEKPREDESGVEAKERFIGMIATLRKQQLSDSPVLLVAHGDTLDAAGESLASQIVFEADYCAWAVFELDAYSGFIASSYGIQMIPL